MSRPLPIALAVALALLLGSASDARAANDAPTIAILDLDNATGDPAFDAAGPGVAAILLTKFTRTEAVRVVERKALIAITDELDLGASGRVDPATAAEAGRLLGADFVVLGSLFTVKLPSISVSVRVVRVQTGEVIVAEEVVGEVGDRGEEFFVLVDEVAYLLLDALQLRLAGRDRIEFGQIEVRQLDTIALFGGALQALDRGEAAEAESLLGQALAREPGFRLAEETLAGIAADIRQRRTAFAHRSVQEVHAIWEAVREELGEDPEAAGAGLCEVALHARLLLVHGDLPGYVAAEGSRLTRTTELLTGLSRDAQRGARRDFTTCWRDTLRGVGADKQVTTTFEDPTFWPFEIRADLADLALRLGRRDEAVGGHIGAWQQRGPQHASEGAPKHPASWARTHGLYDMAAVLQQQELRRAELQGDAKAAKRALDRLEDDVEDAQAAAERDLRWREFVRRVGVEPASEELLDLELDALHAPQEAMHLRRSGYADFLQRVDAGWYDAIREEQPRDWKRIVTGWYRVADSNWRSPRFVERRLAQYLKMQELLPPATDEERQEKQQALEQFVTGAYKP